MSYLAQQKEIRKFSQVRGWTKFHNPKNLAMELAVEASELLEIFQWLTLDESATVMTSTHADHVREEIADMAIYLLRLADALEVNLEHAIAAKLEKNALKYPAPTNAKRIGEPRPR